MTRTSFSNSNLFVLLLIFPTIVLRGLKNNNNNINNNVAQESQDDSDA